MIYCFHCVGEIVNPSGRYCPHCGNEYNVYYPQSNELPPGTYLNNGRYFVGKSIGSGGFSITYIGLDVKVNKKVVIKETFYNGLFKRNSNDKTLQEPLKVTYDSSISIDKIMEKTKKECFSLSKAESLNNIVRVYDWFNENNTAYIITEYINGVTLYDRICEIGHYSWEDLYSHIKPLIQSLAHLHKEDLLHRDIKPHNIMLRKTYKNHEDFVLIDFGLARSNQTRTLGSMGIAFTPGYSPFEQRSFGKKDGTYTDVYAMAATIYHALSGEEPNLEAFDTIDENFPKLKALRNSNDVPNYVVDALEFALQPDYRLRCQTLDDFLLRLENKHTESSTVNDTAINYDRKINQNYYKGDTIASYLTDEPVSTGNSEAQRVDNVYPTQSQYFGDDYNKVQNTYEEPVKIKKRGFGKLILIVASLVLIVGLIAGLNSVGAVNVGKIMEQIEDSEQESTSTERKRFTTDTEKEETVSSIKYVNMPDVEGLSLDSAKTLITSAGLKCEIKEEESDSMEADHILRQYPSAGTEVESGEITQLVVTKKKETEKNTEKETSSVQSKTESENTAVTVPNVKNLSYDAAVQKLSSVGLSADIKEYQYSDTVEDGYVISQSPDRGKVNKNTKISLIVSKGADSQVIKVGNYIGQNIYSVQSELENKGIRVIYSFNDSSVSAGSILSQSVKEGENLPKGSSITFVAAQQSVQYNMLGDFFGELTCSSEMGSFPSGNVLYFNGEAWAPNSSGGVGEYVMFSSPKNGEDVVVSGCIIDIGCSRNNEDFFAYGRPTRIRIEFSDNTSETFDVSPDNMSHQVINFSKKVSTSSMKFIIEGSKAGTSMDNPCIGCLVPF